MKASDECSGMQLDKIEVQPYEGKTIKTVMFNYGKFSSSNIGGNYAPNDVSISSPDRLKLESVNDFNSESGSVLTTSFSYNESIKLPLKRSYAQDYWGYYNGKENKVGNNYTMIPTPQSFMSSYYVPEIDKYTGIGGADRYSDGKFMQAAMLNKVVYPTGGYTTYEYEPNYITTHDFTQTERYRKKIYDVNAKVNFSCAPSPYGPQESGTRRTEFTISEEATCDLLIHSSKDSKLSTYLDIYIYKWNEQRTMFDVIDQYNEKLQDHNEVTSVKKITLPAGKYAIGMVIQNKDKLPFGVTCSLSGWYKSNHDYPLAVGGLRVRKITNYDNDDNKLNYTTYDYSGGVLLDKKETIDYQHLFNGNPKPGNFSIGNISHYIDVFTITSGHSRLPAFFLSCNPGIVGYTYVTKNKYNANGNLEKSIYTSYRNYEPNTFYGVDIYYNFGNGDVYKQVIRDASNAIVATTTNDYTTETVDYYATNIIAKNKYISSYISGNSIPFYETQERRYKDNIVSKEKATFYAQGGTWDILRYPYILSRVEIKSTTTAENCQDGKNIVRTKNYFYNPNNHQVSQIDENTSLSGQIQRTRITYSADGTDAISKSMKNLHRLNDVMKTEKLLVENGNERSLKTDRTNYTSLYRSGSNHYLPSSFSTSIGDNTLETRAYYSYDDSLNVRSITIDGMETVYIWSYKGQYPIAKIEGLTYSQVESAVGASTIASLLTESEPTAKEIVDLRTKISGIKGFITTYTYKPLIGITSLTMPNGLKTTYQYDGFGRLIKVLDHNGKVISTNKYNYKK